jgi:conjugative transfer region protein TrbK
MDPKIIAPAAAVILLAGTVLACAIELARLDRTSESSAPVAHGKMDLLAGELARCKTLGAEAVHGAACKVAWAQNRARFLAPATPRQDRSIELFAATPDAPRASPKIHPDCAPSAPQPDGSTPGTDSAGR